MNVALVLLRSGSEEIKDKNIKMFAGRPLFYWTLTKLEYLKNQEFLDRVIVSTDSDEYIKLVQDYNFIGIEISKRPAALSTDSSTTEDVMIYEIDKNCLDYGYISVMEVTSPLIPISYLRDMVNRDNSLITSFLVTPDTSNFWRKKGEDYEKLYIDRVMRQYNEESLYKEVGAWCVDIIIFKQMTKRIVFPRELIKVPSLYGLSINNKYDFLLAEMIFKDHKDIILES